MWFRCSFRSFVSSSFLWPFGFWFIHSFTHSLTTCCSDELRGRSTASVWRWEETAGRYWNDVGKTRKTVYANSMSSRCFLTGVFLYCITADGNPTSNLLIVKSLKVDNCRDWSQRIPTFRTKVLCQRKKRIRTRFSLWRRAFARNVGILWDQSRQLSIFKLFTLFITAYAVFYFYNLLISCFMVWPDHWTARTEMASDGKHVGRVVRSDSTFTPSSPDISISSLWWTSGYFTQTNVRPHI